MEELRNTIKQIGDELTNFTVRNDKRVDEMAGQLEILDKAVSRMNVPGGGSSTVINGNGGFQNKEWKAAFESFFRKGVNPDGLRKFESSLSTIEDPDGGYLLFPEYSKTIENLALSTIALRRLATVKVIRGSEYVTPVSQGGASSGWVSEKGTRSETDSPSVGTVTIPLHELYANPGTSQRLLDLSNFDISAWIVNEITNSITAEEGEALITGDGVGKPHGIIDESKMVANASWAFGKTGYIAGGHATLLSNADKLLELQHALKPVYRQGATFLMNDTTFEVIRKLKDGDGNYLWRAGLEQGSPDTLLGKPVEIDDGMPDIGPGSYPIAFADFKKAYLICDWTGGLRVLRDPYTSKGNCFFFTVKRVGGGIVNSQAIKFLKISV